jgi:maltose/maltodextrin transport system substrate-binding protein
VGRWQDNPPEKNNPSFVIVGTYACIGFNLPHSQRAMIKKLFCGIFLVFSAAQAFAWTDGELLIWISDNRAYHALGELGKAFEKEVGAPVKVETQEQITEKFQNAAQTGKGPDIFFWAHDRIGEWADAGLIKPLEIKDDFKAGFIPMSWDAVTHNKQIWGYPISLEAVSLIYNKKLVTGKPPTQLSEIAALGKELKEKNPNVIPIMWDYNTPYFSWPFLASAGAYSFKKTENGYNLKDIGVDSPGALEGLQAIVGLMKDGLMPKGATQAVMDQKMSSGALALMINGPWDWPNLRKSGIDFALAPIPGVGGNPGRPFVGVQTALINRASPNADLAMQFLEKYVCTIDGMKAMDADAPIGVPALKTLADEMSAKNPLIKVTYENCQNGEVMPNIPQMGKFWSSMKAAFEIATNGGATPQVALQDARKNMEK